MNGRNIIVSPSGNLYGSEYVLLDFLKKSSLKYQIYAPADSVFLEKLKEMNFKVSEFRDLKWLYLKIFLKLLFSRKFLYVNEGGHISYVKVMARLLIYKKFFISVRLLEDCNSKLYKVSKNISLIAVSKYLHENIQSSVRSIVIYDPYELDEIAQNVIRKDLKFVIGVVGRLTKTKGLDNLISILSNFTAMERQQISIKFFGSYNHQDKWLTEFLGKLNDMTNLEYSLEGFVKDQKQIYSSIDLLIHLNKKESLGRIIFEAVNYNTPFLIFNVGGAAELANLLGLKNYTVEDKPGWEGVFNNEILSRAKKLRSKDSELETAKQIVKEKFNPEKYALEMEAHFKI